MAEYTYKDVIIDPEDPRVEIGKEYYFGDNPTSLLYGVQHNWPIRKLEDVSEQAPSIAPFYNGSSFFACLIRKKEPTYEERQAEWVKANNIKIGDKVYGNLTEEKVRKILQELREKA